MSVLRRAYVQVAPELDGFDRELLEKLRAQDPGSKAGKQVGGQLNRALKRLHLDPIDITADPRTALAKIEETEARLARLSRESPTVEVKVRIDRGLAELRRFKKQLGASDFVEAGEEAAAGFANRFSSRLGPLITEGPGIFVAAGALGAAMAPTVGAALAGAVVGGAGIGGVIGGIVLASKDARVKTAGAELGTFVLGDLTARAAGFVQPTLNAISKIRAGFQDIGPDLDRIFRSSRFIDPLVAGALSGAKKFVAGFADAVDAADPVIQSLSLGIDRIGDAAGRTFTLMASDARVGAESIDELTAAVANLITMTGGILHGAAQVKGWSDEVDTAVDKSRYWIESNSYLAKELRNVGVNLDLTADGFAAGSEQAEAYRRATLGTADAADFATLKQAGMTDVQLLAADASGQYRKQLEQQRAAVQAVAVANGTLIASDDDVKTAQKAATLAQEEYNRLLDTMSPKLTRAAQLSDGLRKATHNLYGAQIDATEANEAYQTSWDALSTTVSANAGAFKRHTSNLTANTTAGRANRDALESLITSTNEAYFADIAAGTAIDAARKKHDNRIKSIEKEAGRLGLNKKATQDLINTYGKIPNNKTTNLLLTGINKIADTLTELYVYQRSLAEGIPLSSARAALKNAPGPEKRFGGYAEGGWTGPGGMYQPAGVVHADEFVVRKNSRRKLEQQNPGLLDHINTHGRLPATYASGGLVAPVELRNLLYRTNLLNTKIPSRAEVAAKAGPTAGGPTLDFMVRVVRAAFPGLGLISGYRPGARTLSGNVSYHALHRAADWPPSRALAEWINLHYKARTKELITPWNDLNIHNGARHAYGGAIYRQHSGGNAHDHWAMAGGGVIREPVLGVGLRSGGSYSFGERGPETVTPGTRGGDTYVFNISGPVASQQAAEDMVVTAVNSARRKRRLP